MVANPLLPFFLKMVEPMLKLGVRLTEGGSIV